jgi:hypothetical protein
MNLLLIPAYFLAGLLTDFLVAHYYLFLSSRQRVRASGLAVAIDFLGYAITMTLVLNRDFVSALAFACGTGLGTFLALGHKK